MNRIRKIKDIYQVLITPNIKFSPDSSLEIRNFEDEDLRNFNIIEFTNLNDAQSEAFQYPDINWHKITLNHKHIFPRIKNDLEKIIYENDFDVHFISNIMSAEDFKNNIFERVLNIGENFNSKYSTNNIISFVIVNPWSNVLKKLSKLIEVHREHLNRDDFRIQSKKVIDNKIICLYGYTEFGTLYEIKFIPSLLYSWSVWAKKNYTNTKQISELYKNYLKKQDTLDIGPILI
jgi:hypothetical protein